MFRFRFQECGNVPELRGGRGALGGGLVEVDGRVVWGGGERKGVYWLNEKDEWKSWAGDVEQAATLGVCGGMLVAVGGKKYLQEVMVWSGGRWSHMSEMLLGCVWSCVVSVGGGGLLVMGGFADGIRHLAEVQVFDGNTRTWHLGLSHVMECQ